MYRERVMSNDVPPYDRALPELKRLVRYLKRERDNGSEYSVIEDWSNK